MLFVEEKIVAIGGVSKKRICQITRAEQLRVAQLYVSDRRKRKLRAP